ncbi:MAG: hypothetical protein K5839_02715, partial [Treponemataceae bacterium]|nr:hypothetical protein [Treponemataceae bacterium]
DSGHQFCNERLEFLGDTVLDCVVASYLYQQLPEIQAFHYKTDGQNQSFPFHLQLNDEKKPG